MKNYSRNLTHSSSKITWLIVTQLAEWCTTIVLTPKKDHSILDYVWTCQNSTDMYTDSDTSLPLQKQWTALQKVKCRYSSIWIQRSVSYHHYLMDEQTWLLTIILTPFGYFKYKQAPYTCLLLMSTTTY